MTEDHDSGAGPSDHADESSAAREQMLKCYECGADTPVKDGALCWSCQQKAAAGGTPSAGGTAAEEKIVKTGESVGRTVVGFAWALLILGALGAIGLGSVFPEVSYYGSTRFNWNIAITAAFITFVQFLVLRALGYVVLLLTVVAGRASSRRLVVG